MSPGATAQEEAVDFDGNGDEYILNGVPTLEEAAPKLTLIMTPIVTLVVT